MAALDTFEWFVTSLGENPPAEMRDFILSQREYLLTLRSEDERQRLVDDLIRELRRRTVAALKHQ